ncbi:hypothetical protein ECZU12_49190 [Escherichia coli]|nr:hypothetical protein ECZU12_49190 [Escherichia coli]
MADFDNLFDAAIARADETIRGYMGTSATMTSGEQSGAVIRGVFDPENISYAGQGVRVEGSSPSCLSGLMMCGSCGAATR